MLDTPSPVARRKYDAAVASKRADQFAVRWYQLAMMLHVAARAAAGERAVALRDRALDCERRAAVIVRRTVAS